jgi:hypothetical protein
MNQKAGITNTPQHFQSSKASIGKKENAKLGEQSSPLKKLNTGQGAIRNPQDFN